MFLIFHLDRLDVLPVDDLGLGQAMARLYGLDPADRARMAGDLVISDEGNDAVFRLQGSNVPGFRVESWNGM